MERIRLTLLTDGGVDNVSAAVDELIDRGALRRVLAQTEISPGSGVLLDCAALDVIAFVSIDLIARLLAYPSALGVLLPDVDPHRLTLERRVLGTPDEPDSRPLRAPLNWPPIRCALDRSLEVSCFAERAEMAVQLLGRSVLPSARCLTRRP